MGVQVSGLLDRQWSWCDSKEIPVREYFNLVLVFNTLSEHDSAELLWHMLEQSSPMLLSSAVTSSVAI